ncbi:olfactory receptor 14A16-like [Rhineura floridana]|uniref:olfactory receptor 14A16-like n=1 Tax=Rhineura floridana TaxID=261503 RepID=UPI002AC80B8E|nr:olfactory receptor 14A16-like [Rhineura floridana]
MHNLTSMPTFLLMGFSEIRKLQILHFFVFLALYLTAIIGNLLLVLAIAIDRHLRTPMYFFLINLAMMDIGIISVIVPKSMAISLLNSRWISYFGCVAQVFLYFLFATSEFLFLTIMAHDRSVAIRNPLQYETIMHKGACIQMVAIVWMTSLVYAILNTCGTFANTFCSVTVKQFFCEVPTLLKISCTDLYLVEVWFLVISCSIALGCFIFIIITYMQIFSTVLKIPSTHGQKKALSTCVPHLTIVSVFMCTGFFAYVRPPTDASSDLYVAFAMIYTIIPPTLNPFIYSMRNKEIKTALWKLFNQGHSSKSFSKVVF